MASATTEQALSHVRSLLLKLSPTAAKGFEGLAADALSGITGLNVRLAKSGSQAGRDASSTPSSEFAIALEAKLYRRDLPLEALAGKSVLAGFYLAGQVDVWAVATTSEVGDQTITESSAILEERGITLLVLDWAQNPLPPLAVLLAAAKVETMHWFAKWHRGTDKVALAQALDQIAADPNFEGELLKLRRAVSRAEVGLGALRLHNEAWLRARISDANLSQTTFGQRITVGATSTTALPRTEMVNELGGLVIADETETSVVAVLGGEGAGKTWLVAQWWALQAHPPILILVAGRRSEHLNPADPVSSLARLLAEQEGRTDEAALASWKRRLRRWKAQAMEGVVRFVVVLDGLNERASMPWADIIRAMAGEIKALGGMVIVTSRKAYWTRDVLPKLRTGVSVRSLTVLDYSDAELELLLASVEKTLAELPAKVRAFIRNPRICAVALSLLDRLAVQPGDLTIERLLLDYWQWRLEERGDGLIHGIEDFHKLLIAHARTWRGQPRKHFNRDDWAAYSGAAKRLGPAQVANDLTEIEEGQFLTITSSSLNNYEFKPDALPFAIGLLINEELQEGIQEGGIPTDELLDRIIDPVRGFDQIADILTAAIGLACLNQNYPAAGRQALVLAWMRLQNISDEAFESIQAYIPVAPTAFLDILELPSASLGNGGRTDYLVLLLLNCRDDPALAAEVAIRLPRWLGSWSRGIRSHWHDGKDQEREGKRDVQISANIEKMSAPERIAFRSLTTEFPQQPAAVLDRIAAFFAARRTQSLLGVAIFGWGLATANAGDYPHGQSELEWVVRLNQIDWQALRDGVWMSIASVDASSSDGTRSGAAKALRLVGDIESAARADVLSPLTFHPGWRRVELFCSTDPFDPSALAPEDFERARSAVNSLDPLAVWTTMSTTAEDIDLRDASAGSIRFEPAGLISKFNEIAATAPERTGLPLRQLGWHLPWLAPILTTETRIAIGNALSALIADPTRAPENQDGWIVGQYAGSLIPNAEPREQLEILLSLPPGTPLYYNLRHGAKALAAEDFEVHLEAALAAGLSSEHLNRVLFHAGATRANLTDRARQMILECTASDDKTTVLFAGEVIAVAQDAKLYEQFLDKMGQINASSPERREGLGRAGASAVAFSGRAKFLDQVPARYLGWTVLKLGSDYLDMFGTQTEAALNRLLRPASAVPPNGIEMFYDTSDDDLEASRRFEDIPDDKPQDLAAGLREFNDAEAAAARFSQRQRDLHREVKAYEAVLSKEDASDILAAPPRNGLKEYAAHDPKRVCAWLRTILNVTSPAVLWQIHNVSLTLASAFAEIDGALSAEVFEKFRGGRTALRVMIGSARIPLYQHALFAAGEASELEPLRRKALDGCLKDSEIEQAVITAEVYGPPGWLDRYVPELVAKSEPSFMARAITAAGFRSPNPHSDHLLAQNWGDGFLGDVASDARDAYERAKWTQHWLEQMATATDPVEMWRYAQLVEGVADRRAYAVIKNLRPFSALALSYEGKLLELLRKAVEKREKKRSETLFGVKAPDPTLVALLRNNPIT
jgi:hypothetical protein